MSAAAAGPARRASREALDALAAAWQEVRARTPGFLAMRDPTTDVEAEAGAIAYHRLDTGRIHVDLVRCQRLGLLDCLPSLLMHELGHHLHHPRSFAQGARQQLFLATALGRPVGNLTNMFADTLIDRALAPPHDHQMVRILRALKQDEQVQSSDPLGHFFWALQEAIFRLPQGSLAGPASIRALHAFRPTFRRDLRALFEGLERHPDNVFTQLLAFAACVRPYLPPAPRHQSGPQARVPSLPALPGACEGAPPGTADWLEALSPDPKEAAALEAGAEEGWVDAKKTRELRDLRDPLQGIRAFSTSHADSSGETQDLAAAYYAQLADSYRITPPPRPTLGDPYLPATLEPWQAGDPIQAIDWLATVGTLGPSLGAAAPVLRERLAEEEGETSRASLPRLEVWLDTSGSMPDPAVQRNPMTLAAMILARSTLAAGGSVRGIIYSDQYADMPAFSRDADEVQRFLMGAFRAGTWFPFQALARSLDRERHDPPTRVVITDADFLGNMDADASHRKVLADAATRSHRLVLVIACPDHPQLKEYRRLGARVLRVDDQDRMPEVAAGLALELEEGRR